MRKQIKTLLQRGIKRIIDRFGWDYTELSMVVDYDPEDIRIINEVRPFTMTNFKRLHALIQAVRYVASNDVPGAIVECGVFRGGSMMAAAKTLLALKRTDRVLYLYDTYEGMPESSARDVRFDGQSAVGPDRGKNAPPTDKMRRSGGSDGWCRCSLEDVRSNMLSTGYSPEKMMFVKGKVEETIPGVIPDKISILRLDTDWEASTRHELIHLYPRLVVGGILIIDDYGHWRGVREVVDEYVAQNKIKLFLNRVDYSCRIAVKTH